MWFEIFAGKCLIPKVIFVWSNSPKVTSQIGNKNALQRDSEREREEMVFDSLLDVAGAAPVLGYKSGYAKGYSKGFKVITFFMKIWLPIANSHHAVSANPPPHMCPTSVRPD